MSKKREWIKYGKPWKTFLLDQLGQPGTFVKVDGKKYLIGNINCNGGQCDCCTAFQKDDIVEEYRKAIIK